MEILWILFKTLKLDPPNNSTILFLVTYPKKSRSQKQRLLHCVSCLLQANQPRCPSIGKQITKIGHMYTTVFSSSLKEDDIIKLQN